LIKNAQPFGKKFQKTVGGGDFFDSHCMYHEALTQITLLNSADSMHQIKSQSK